MRALLEPFLFATTLALWSTSVAVAETLYVVGETVHTMAGPPMENGVIVIENGKFTQVGTADEIDVPTDANVLRAAVVTPGFVDAHTTIGLSGMLNQIHDQEQVEKSAPMQPELRAIDAYNARDELVDWVRGFGVTTIHTGHGPGSLIAGQTMIVKTDRENISDGVLSSFAMVAGAMGEAGMKRDNGSPGTRAKAAALLRAELIKAREYLEKIDSAEKGKEPARNLRLEALGEVLQKEKPLLLTVHRQQDILTALRIADEFDLKLILDGCAEAHLVIDEIKAAGVPVIIHPTMARPSGDRENMTFEAAAKLNNAEIPFALQSGFEPYVPKTRVVPFEAAMTLGYGLSFEDALASITIDSAQLLGIADRVGSIETGKDADLALFDGDPFEFLTHCIGVVIDGKPHGGERSE
jgi:imidazolonepropionase-like amidohydrolase